MAEEKQKNPGHQLLWIAMVVFYLASQIGTWQLFIVAVVLVVLGIMLTISHAVSTQQSVTQQTAEGIDPFLPTSKGVAWLEFATKYMDNPDTAVQPVGAQPDGSRPSLEGVSAAQFGLAYDSDEFAKGVSGKEFNIGFRGEEFAGSGTAQFVEHLHSSPVPRSWYDPVSEWYDPVSAWYDPFG